MNYVLFICGDESLELSVDQQREIDRAADAWVEEMTARGVRRTGNRLQSVADATTVRVSGDDVLISDGPFAETREQIGGFDLIECADLDEAVEIAAKHPVAKIGTIEIRPFWTP
jgi:hypothetical protein